MTIAVPTELSRCGGARSSRSQRKCQETSHVEPSILSRNATSQPVYIQRSSVWLTGRPGLPGVMYASHSQRIVAIGWASAFPREPGAGGTARAVAAGTDGAATADLPRVGRRGAQTLTVERAESRPLEWRRYG